MFHKCAVCLHLVCARSDGISEVKGQDSYTFQSTHSNVLTAGHVVEPATGQEVKKYKYCKKLAGW